MFYSSQQRTNIFPQPSSEVQPSSQPNQHPEVSKTHLNRRYSNRLMLLAALLLSIIVFEFQSIPSVDAFVRPAGKSGLLKLCPPGGESFATAWQITCGMKRRKKRDIDSEALASISPKNDTQTDSNEPGAEVSAKVQAGDAITNPEPLLKPIAVDSIPSENDKEYKSIQKRSPFWNSFLPDSNPFAYKTVHTEPNPEKEREEEELLYRAPSMTEMMMVCCRFGCSLRDLLPYCDPFGQWDS
ncbi:hypothetical protein Ddc_15506 [Ditylenchus destructor]|nr:hypothetical protein Ddc_15506 [Ditylenchus destructor]